MVIPDIDAYADLFAGLEGAAQAELAACSSVAELRGVVERYGGVERFDDLVEVLGGDPVFEDLRAVLTAMPYGDVFARPAGSADEWVWAASRDAPAGDWQPFGTLATGEDSQVAAEISVLDESNAIYVRVLGELADPSPEEAGRVWEDIWTKVTAQAVDWTPDAGARIGQEVVDAFYQGLTAEPTVEDLIQAVDGFAAEIRSIATA
ncbi:hypothetical protein AB5J62_22405 [Amycolatopsis sp. cg5]|uniref:hypothetical protein n=1 Tax=Amycolatopsis sp. cg5 TaxID=3238802 RepID=UPI003525C222